MAIPLREEAVEAVTGQRARIRQPSRLPSGPRQLAAFLRAQRVNLARHAAGLRPFRPGEFGRHPASPSAAHQHVVNRHIDHLRRRLFGLARQLAAAGDRAIERQEFEELQRFTRIKDQGHRWVKATEKIWDFYNRLFSQRQTRVAPMLLASDRIGLDCYQAIYTGLGTARSIPAPPPFSFMETGMSPATYRRGIVLSLIGRRANPFPLIKLPYHRLINPWTLGAIPHEVAHNIQSDLGLWRMLPKLIYRRLRARGVDRFSAGVWSRWHKEIFADLCGLLLSGPAFVASLMAVVGRAPRRTLSFNPSGVHPTPYLRVFINVELLRRMGFAREASAFQQAWDRIYPRRLARALPAPLMRSFARANRIVVSTICFTPLRQLGGRSLAEVVSFGRKEQKMVEEAAGRLAAGTDPGIIPERFFIGAARVALEARLARPAVISSNFYNALGRR